MSLNQIARRNMKRKMLSKIAKKKHLGLRTLIRYYRKYYIYMQARNLMLLCPPVLYKYMDRMLKVRMPQSHKNEQECRFIGDVEKFRYSLFMILPIMNQCTSISSQLLILKKYLWYEFSLREYLHIICFSQSFN